MGTFMGHVLPGSFFLSFGLWSIVQMLRRYYASKGKGIQFSSSPTFKSSCLCGILKNYEVEGSLKVVLCTVGITGELITGFDKGKLIYYANAQHSTMFFTFGLSGAVDVLRHHKFHITEDFSYAMLLVSFVVEGVLFKYHLHDRDRIDVLIHMVLVYTIFCNALAVLAEIRYRNSLLAAISRGYFTVLQGVWFIAVAFILYNPFAKNDWNPENHDHFMLATMLFTWHIVGTLILIFLLNCIIATRYNRTFKMPSSNTPYHNDVQERARLLDTNANGNFHAVKFEDDDNFESEYLVKGTPLINR